MADDVNKGLARCGFSYDESGVLARDPHWRLSRSGWVSVFQRCLEVWDWNHLLRASIAFDFRRVAGDLDIVTPLSGILRQAPRRGGFLSGLGHLASQIPSPLGFRGRLTGPMDIKKSGLLPVENLARFYAFARGISAGQHRGAADDGAAAGQQRRHRRRRARPHRGLRQHVPRCACSTTRSSSAAASRRTT